MTNKFFKLCDEMIIDLEAITSVRIEKKSKPSNVFYIRIQYKHDLFAFVDSLPMSYKYAQERFDALCSFLQQSQVSPPAAHLEDQ